MREALKADDGVKQEMPPHSSKPPGSTSPAPHGFQADASRVWSSLRTYSPCSQWAFVVVDVFWINKDSTRIYKRHQTLECVRSCPGHAGKGFRRDFYRSGFCGFHEPWHSLGTFNSSTLLEACFSRGDVCRAQGTGDCAQLDDNLIGSFGPCGGSGMRWAAMAKRFRLVLCLDTGLLLGHLLDPRFSDESFS